MSASAARWNTQSTPRNSGAMRAASVMSTSSTASFGSAATWSRFLRRPVLRLSRTSTRWPSARKRSTRWLPMKPAPPVTIAREEESVIRSQRSLVRRPQPTGAQYHEPIASLDVSRLRRLDPIREHELVFIGLLHLQDDQERTRFSLLDRSCPLPAMYEAELEPTFLQSATDDQTGADLRSLAPREQIGFGVLRYAVDRDESLVQLRHDVLPG